MIKNTGMLSTLVCSMWALQLPSGVPHGDVDQETFNIRINELQRSVFKVRGQLLGLDLPRMGGDFVAVYPEEIMRMLTEQLCAAYELEQLAREHQTWCTGPEYAVLLKMIDQLHDLEQKLARRHGLGDDGTCAYVPHINPFK